MASGVAVSDDCVTVFNDLKLKHDKKYIIFSMNPAMTEIQVLKSSSKDASYEEFVAEFPSGSCRYGVFDVEYTDPKTGGQRNKIVFFSWCDDNARVKEKMIYASSKDELKKRLVGIATEVQANDKSGFDMKDVVDRVVKV
uniref:ADF-H domain-containing protein n=1 Tax=Cryptomonas curvata TaxID=233186 RepID=A0A7S0MAT1_9CRYP|mmetsp:Transcript_28514/g.59614  ORF Transcript_28514/g.59614 Transcript_28514/m.59614 type:complete len:140 (+) Transcript_28514:45-464(+)